MRLDDRLVGVGPERARVSRLVAPTTGEELGIMVKVLETPSWRSYLFRGGRFCRVVSCWPS